MKLSEIRGEKAIDVLADLIEPLSEIFSDDEIVKGVRGNANKMELIKLVLRNHKTAVLTVLALLDGEDPANYNPTLISIPSKVLEVLNDPDVAALFPGSGQASNEISS